MEHVVSSQCHGRGGHIQYLVKWKGYLDSENQWINWRDMGNTEEAIAEFQNCNPNAVSHIKRLRDNDELPTITLHPPHFTTSSSFMTDHGEDIVLEEGEVVKTGQVEQAVPLPIPPCTTPPVPTIPLLSISEWIEGDGPRQEAIMATLMQI